MRHLFEKIQESFRSIVEIIILVLVLFIPTIVDVVSWIEVCFKATQINFDNIKYYFLLRAGNGVGGLLLMLWVLTRIRAFNKEKIFNTKNVYHDYPYLWYWICAKILGYTKCNLKLVPPYLQFKLVLNDTFQDYYVGADDDYPTIENEQVEIKKINFEEVSTEVNLVLADTYPISSEQMPAGKRRLSTIVVNRKRPDVSRYYSPRFISTIVDEVRNLPENVTDINVFPTTNPRHALRIVRDTFKLADRGNIKKLVVFPQDNKGVRKFERKGKVICNNK